MSDEPDTEGHEASQPVVHCIEEPVRASWSWIWIVPALALIAAAILGYQAFSQRGTRVWITFSEGSGIRPGDPVTSHGVNVGRIDDVQLDGSLSQVVVQAVLAPNAAGLAVEGSRFWIVRPQVSLKGVQGLDALLGPRYLQVLPGSPGSTRKTRFEGLTGPPRLTQSQGSREVILKSKRKWALKPGAPVTYRDLPVGQIVEVRFNDDRSAVLIVASIDAEMADLIYEKTKFWYVGGVGIDFGLLGGLTVRAGSLESMISGGIAFANPSKPGKAASSGHRFDLAPQADSDWLGW